MRSRPLQPLASVGKSATEQLSRSSFETMRPSSRSPGDPGRVAVFAAVSPPVEQTCHRGRTRFLHRSLGGHPTGRRRVCLKLSRPGSSTLLAAVLGVNTNTVLRALRDLREEGLFELPGRGRGVTVSGTPERGAVIARTRELVEFARRQGYRPDELARIIEELG